jgi:DNA-binding MarR family transcriptional regulator
MHNFTDFYQIFQKLENIYHGIKRNVSKHLPEHLKVLTVEQIQILQLLWLNDRIKQTEISVHLNKDKPSISRIVQTMSSHDLIERMTPNADKRIKYICLTKLGKDIQPAVEQAIQASMDHVFSDYDTDEVDFLVSLLDRAKH